MKFVYIVLAIAVIGGVTVLLTNQSAEAPNRETELADEMHDDEHMDDDSHEMGNEDDELMSGDENTVLDADIDTSVSIDSGAEVFNLSGKNFEFNVTEIRVKKGDTVTINFESESGFHDWVIDEFDASTDQVRPGTKTSVTFVADQAGTFEYYCSVGSHRANGMVGKLIVE